MKARPKVGTTGEERFVVGPEHVIDFSTDGMPAVLCTPWLIWFLEHAARRAVLPLLDASESTVGTHIEVRHLAPTPLGQAVTCRARIIHAEGAVVSFQLEAHDEREPIAKGSHRLQVIRVDRFAQKVHNKSVAGATARAGSPRSAH